MDERLQQRQGPLGWVVTWVTSGGCVPILALQWLLFLVVAFVPFGFDHPNRFGLDFGDLMAVVAFWAILTLGGIVAMLVKGKPEAALFVLLNAGFQVGALLVAHASGITSLA